MQRNLFALDTKRLNWKRPGVKPFDVTMIVGMSHADDKYVGRLESHRQYVFDRT
jgi:hypothetical protein